MELGGQKDEWSELGKGKEYDQYISSDSPKVEKKT